MPGRAGERTWGRALEIAIWTGASTSAQCAASMPSAARIPNVSAMATPAVPISWRRWGIDRSADPLFRPVRSAGAARFAVWRVASDARWVGVPSRRSARTAKRITITITITTPTRAIHSASFIGPLAAVVARPSGGLFTAPWTEVCHIAPVATRGLAARTEYPSHDRRSSCGDDRLSHGWVTSPTTHCTGGGRLRTMTWSRLLGGT